MTAQNNKDVTHIAFHQSINFTFDGVKYRGFKGDTIASALIRNNVRIIGRSFKYHRPRGIYTCGIEEPNALVQILSEHNEPNTRATIKQIYEGLEVESQNRWPSLENDLGSINSLLSPLFSAGFYNKTFMRPRGFWKKVYEPLIRKAAGLGKPPKPFRTTSTQLHHHVDVVIVGGGLSGLLAAKSLAKTELKILIIEQDSFLGGILKNSNKISTIENKDNRLWIKELENKLEGLENIKILKNTLATTYNYINHLIAIEDRTTGTLPLDGNVDQILHKIRADHIILANGHIERLVSFRNNDLPGIMLAGSFEKFIQRYGVIPETNPVIFSNNSSCLSLIKKLIDLNCKPQAYVDSRSGDKIEPELLKIIHKKNIPLFTNAHIEGCDGKKQVQEISVRDAEGIITKLKSKMLCVSGGFNPDVHLFTQSKGVLSWDDEYLTFKPDKSFQNTIVLGSNAGIFQYSKIVNDINTKLSFLNHEPLLEIDLTLNDTDKYSIEKLWEIKHEKESRWSKSFIDLQNDVTTKDLRQGIQEGFDRIEHLKRFTTNSMGTDQGKISSINALGIVSEILDKKVSEVGTTIYRPPYAPLSFASIAGRGTYDFYDPERKTSIHEWHKKNGAIFEDVGQWKRPWYFKSHPGENLYEAVQREALHVRKYAGVLDGSTLGKIEIKGSDALEFMNLMYTNNFSKMKPMSARYALMLGEDGMVMDDGIISKINDKHFIATTTTGGAAKVLSHMEEFAQTEWPHLNVFLNSITEQFCTFNISGPNTRLIMEKVFKDIKFDNENFPFMTFGNFTYLKSTVRILRASFTGELGYEIYVRPSIALKLWEDLFRFGKDEGLIAYGTETMHLLRAEKGYIIVGQDTDGSVTPQDMDLEWMIGKNKKDFIGKRSLTRTDTIRSDRKQLVGIKPIDPNDIIEEGQHIILTSSIKPPVKMLGHVTSSYVSPNLGHSFGMAVIKDGKKLIGSKAYVSSSSKGAFEIEIIRPIFIDEENKSLVS
ncbi:2Fe-2S iron-sulfur cluster-binding protein [Alphaproteobacteria bacterium]|nr:2Fe-2S iron-sulfur cluster-binding protein [Alphaproteobacteria bacterium]